MTFRKGQATIETMAILAISVVALMAIMAGSQERLSASEGIFAKAQIDSSLKKLTDATNFVYSQSVGTTMDVKIDIPSTVQNIRIRTHSFEYNVSTASGAYNTVATGALAKLNGTIDISSGTVITLTNRGEYVQVSQSGG